jgi:hypothetical protein
MPIPTCITTGIHPNTSIHTLNGTKKERGESSDRGYHAAELMSIKPLDEEISGEKQASPETRVDEKEILYDLDSIQGPDDDEEESVSSKKIISHKK